MRGFGGIWYPLKSKQLIFNSPNWGNLELEEFHLYDKKKIILKLAILPLWYQFISIYLDCSKEFASDKIFLLYTIV